MSESIARAVAERLNLRPSMIAPAYASMAASDLQMLAKANAEKEQAAAVAARADLLAAFGFSCNPGVNKPFAFASGIAFIPVTGILINRFGQSWGGYVTGYNYIRTMLNLALADPDVERIVFDGNSYGGEVAGCFELADDIYAARGQKPMLAVVDSNCYSACMAVLSGADRIIVTPSGGAGSIGVVCMHVSYRKMLEDFGMDITFIYSGSHKVDGNPYEDLSPEVKAAIQADVDDSRQKFAALVARNRGLDVQAVLDTEAQSYRAEEALALGLIDAVMPPTKAVAAFLNELSGSDDENEESDMTTATAKQPGTEGNSAPAAAAPAPAPAADIAQAAAPATDAGADARKAERARIAAITGLPEAAGKSRLANHLALNTELSVDDAKAMLAAAAPETAAAPVTNAFAAAMDNGDNPEVGAGGGNGGAAANPGASKASSILAAHTAVTGWKHDKK